MRIPKTLAAILIVLLLAALTACAPAESTEPDTQPQQTQETADNRPDTDRSGNPITLPDQVNSIISILKFH